MYELNDTVMKMYNHGLFRKTISEYLHAKGIDVEYATVKAFINTMVKIHEIDTTNAQKTQSTGDNFRKATSGRMSDITIEKKEEYKPPIADEDL